MGAASGGSPPDGTRSTGARSGWAVLAAVALLLSAGSASFEYTVGSGDTLTGIAQRHGTTVSALLDANDMGDPDRLAAGTTVTIPEGGGGPPTSRSGSSTHHVVRPGETLSDIGMRYGIPVAQLAEWNGLDSGHTVFADSRISVSGPAAQDVAAPDAGASRGTHRVATGETLTAIATRFGVGVDELAEANAIADPNRIVAGTVLAVPGGGGWACPVRGSRTFVNDFGYGKPDGRFHNGVDVFAPRGTPVVAPVAGRVEQVTGTLAGRQFTLQGVDGHVYIGTHLDRFGASGEVPAGEVLGTVGTSGNAEGTSPHLHFEVHADGQRVTNPYPSLRTACG